MCIVVWRHTYTPLMRCGGMVGNPRASVLEHVGAYMYYCTSFVPASIAKGTLCVRGVYCESGAQFCMNWP